MKHWFLNLTVFFCSVFYICIIIHLTKKARWILASKKKEEMNFREWRTVQAAKREVYSPFVAFALIFGLLFSIRWYHFHSIEFLRETANKLGESRSTFLAVTIALGLGITANWYKQYDSHRYGIVEIVLGCIGAGIATAYISVANFYATVMGFISCVYVVSRGVDNWRVGISKEKIEERNERREKREYKQYLGAK